MKFYVNYTISPLDYMGNPRYPEQETEVEAKDWEDVEDNVRDLVDEGWYHIEDTANEIESIRNIETGETRYYNDGI